MENYKKDIGIVQVIGERMIDGKQFRVWGTPENPLFLAREVAVWLGYKDTNHNAGNSMLKRITLDEDEKFKLTALYPHGDTFIKKQMLFVTESGLYEIAMRSTKPKAKQFKQAVKKMLREIRLSGGYIPTTDSMSDDEILSKAYEIAQRTLKISGVESSPQLIIN